MKRIRTADATYRLTAISLNVESGAWCLYYRDERDNHTGQRRADATADQVRGEDDAWDFVATKVGGVVEDAKPEASEPEGREP